MGGRSTEHGVSLRSASFIYNTLDREKFQVKPILITQSGDWLVPSAWNGDWSIPPELASRAMEADFNDQVEALFLSRTGAVRGKAWENPTAGGCDVFVLGVHGGEGEDGRLQAYLEAIGMAYTGSGVLASALAMDKYRANLLFEASGIPTARCMDLHRDDFLRAFHPQKPGNSWESLNRIGLSFPVFSKPTTGGSSVGTFRADNAEEWERKIYEVFNSEERMLVQENIQGREVSCGVIERPGLHGWERMVLPPTEIIPETDFFDYQAKYIPGKSREVTPAPMPPEWIERIQELSRQAHEILGCQGYSRTDFIVDAEGKPWILETNTLPGMTGTSLVPQQAAVVGIQMKQLFTWLVRLALERKGILWPWEAY